MQHRNLGTPSCIPNIESAKGQSNGLGQGSSLSTTTNIESQGQGIALEKVKKGAQERKGKRSEEKLNRWEYASIRVPLPNPFMCAPSGYRTGPLLRIAHYCSVTCCKTAFHASGDMTAMIGSKQMLDVGTIASRLVEEGARGHVPLCVMIGDPPYHNLLHSLGGNVALLV